MLTVILIWWSHKDCQINLCRYRSIYTTSIGFSPYSNEICQYEIPLTAFSEQTAKYNASLYFCLHGMNKVPVMSEIMIIAIWTVMKEIVKYRTTTQGKPSVHKLTCKLLMKSFANWLLMNLLTLRTVHSIIQLKTSLISVYVLYSWTIHELFANICKWSAKFFCELL